MNSVTERKRLFASIGALLLLSTAGLVIWSVLLERAAAAKLESEILKGLSLEQIQAVLKSEAVADKPSIAELAESPEKRKAFLNGLREHLALAAAARREGLAEDADFKINFAYKKNILLADLYRAKLSQGKERLFVVPAEEMQAVWKDAANEAAFNRDMDALRRIQFADAEARGGLRPPSELAGEMLRNARDNWARVRVLSGMAKADAEFMSQTAIPLRIKILESGLLSNDYLRVHASSFKAAEEEVHAYLAEHPEYDPARKLETARLVLRKAKAGEDFEALAKTFSEDNGSRDRGGLYREMAEGALWPEVERVAAAMKPGEVYPEIVETKLGFHVVKLAGRTSKPGEGIRLSIRHVVLQKNFREPGEPVPGLPRPFMSPEEIARGEIEKKKRKEFISYVLEQNAISLPEDFELSL